VPVEFNPHPYSLTISLRSILLLFSHLCLCFPSGIFPSSFLTKILHTFVNFPVHATCLILLQKQLQYNIHAIIVRVSDEDFCMEVITCLNVVYCFLLRSKNLVTKETLDTERIVMQNILEKYAITLPVCLKSNLEWKMFRDSSCEIKTDQFQCYK
jgi:hypothetical protein